MRKFLAVMSILAMAALTSPARATVITQLHLEFQSGAVFNGSVTFNDNFAGMLDASGTLTGGPWGTKSINWTWLAGTGGVNPQDLDGNASTYEDWLMDGFTPGNHTIYIGISWLYPVLGNVPTIEANTDILYHGINIEDRIVSGRFSQVPEPGTLLLLSLGFVSLITSYWRKSKQDWAASSV